MTYDAQPAGFLGRIWQFLLKVSEVAVAGHYHAPWLQAEAARDAGKLSRKTA